MNAELIGRSDGHSSPYGRKPFRRTNVSQRKACTRVFSEIILSLFFNSLYCGGEGGIRTHGTVARTPHFECGAFDHSATSPKEFFALSARVPASVGRGPLAVRTGGCLDSDKHGSISKPSDVLDPMSRTIDIPLARFGIGDVVRHKMFDFRGVIFDVDPFFANSEEWYEAIPEALRPVEGPALLSPSRRECRQQLHRLRQPAESRCRRERRADRSPGDRDHVRMDRRRPVPLRGRTAAIIRAVDTVVPCHRRLAFARCRGAAAHARAEKAEFKRREEPMFAVVRTGGKQYRIHPGDKIVVEKLAGNAGDKVTLGDVLFAGEGPASSSRQRPYRSRRDRCPS